MRSETDCELLKLAAKAAGYEVIQYSDYLGCQIIDYEDGDTAWFDPINDDGDAFGLAIKLYIGTEFFRYATQANFIDTKGGSHRVNVGISEGTCNGSRAAASRRAIVRAAAEIGRNME